MEVKVKPKHQWDRYLDLKGQAKFPVAVRVEGDGNDWLEVGNVRSRDDAYTELAVARQRALVAEASLLASGGIM